MSKTSVFIAHGEDGGIVAIGRAMDESTPAVLVGGKGESVIVTEVEEEQIQNLPHTHVVDITRRAMIERPTDSTRTSD
jgi:hypothetical protein